MPRMSVRRVLLFLVITSALAFPIAAWADTLTFFSGDLAPSTNAQSSSHQFRYGKGADWVVATRCAKMWYRNNGSSVQYAVIQECDGHMVSATNTSPSTATTWVYCRNVSTATINIACYSCVNNDIGCG